MSPEAPFYLLDDGGQPIPSLSYPMLNKCLAIHVLEAWADYLWARGRQAGQGARLIELLNDGAGQGYAAWRVLPAPEAWQGVVTKGAGKPDNRVLTEGNHTSASALWPRPLLPPGS